MLNLRMSRRTQQRKETRRIRRTIELLEARRLMAVDLDVSSFGNSGGQSMDSPPAIEWTIDNGPVIAAQQPPTVTRQLGTNYEANRKLNDDGNGGADAAPAGNQPSLKPLFFPSCPVVPPDDGSIESTDGASLATEMQIKPAPTPTHAAKMAGPQSIRERGPLGGRGSSHLKGALQASSISTQPPQSIGLGETAGNVSPQKSLSDDFHYFTDDVDGRPPEGPSLINHALAEYVDSDSFMVMALLPSPSVPQDYAGAGLPSESELRRHGEKLPQIDAQQGDLDLDSLRRVATIAELSEIAVPRSFLAATTDSLSATVACAVSMNWFDGNTNSSRDEDASLISKINENRYHVAAFALVFTAITTRMNKSDSPEDDSVPRSEQHRADNRI